MINYTAYSQPLITNYCFNWCKEQHFIHQNNLTVNILSIPILALLTLFVCYLIYNYNDFILRLFKESNLTEHTLNKIFGLALEFAIYLLIGFFIWFIWFK